MDLAAQAKWHDNTRQGSGIQPLSIKDQQLRSAFCKVGIDTNQKAVTFRRICVAWHETALLQGSYAPGKEAAQRPLVQIETCVAIAEQSRCRAGARRIETLR